MEKFQVRVCKADGYTYSLPPEISSELKSLYPDRIYPPRIFIADLIGTDMGEESQRSRWGTLVEMLAGVGVGEFDMGIPVEFLFQDTGNTYNL